MLKEKILKKLDSEGKGFSEKIAKLVGYSSGSALRKTIKEAEGESRKFNSLSKIVQVLFSNNELEIMKEYALSVDPKKQHARCMIEWLEANKLHEEKRKLIEKMLNCNNVFSETFAKIYNVHDQYIRREINTIEAIRMYGKISTKKPEENVAIKIYQSYIYLDNQNYDMIYQSFIDIDEEIEQIKDDYIKDMYRSRVYMGRAVENLRRNNIAKVKELCQYVLDNSNNLIYKIFAYLNMGNSYLLEDFNKSIDCYKNGLELCKEWHEFLIINLKRSITFACNLWGEKSNYFNLNSDHPSDIHEVAFYYIKFKQYIKATKELDKVDFDKLTNNQKAFHMYYRGLISNKMEDFTKSIIYFRKSGDYFFKQLPVLELKKFGIDDCILEALAS